jgi:hypothetical protein
LHKQKQENVDDPQIVTDQPRSRLQKVDRAMKDIVDHDDEGAVQAKKNCLFFVLFLCSPIILTAFAMFFCPQKQHLKKIWA